MTKLYFLNELISCWFLSLIFCFNISCQNQGSKSMNINRNPNCINLNKNKTKNQKIDSDYKRLMQYSKKQEFINNIKLVRAYLKDNKFNVLDCLIEIIAKNLENWNYDLVGLFNDSFFVQSSKYKILQKNGIDLLTENYLSTLSENIYLENNLNIKVFKKSPLSLIQFLSMAEECEKINKKWQLTNRKEYKYSCNLFVYQIIYFFLKSIVQDDQFDIKDTGLLFVNSMRLKDLFILLCIEKNKISITNEDIFFSKLCGMYVKSCKIEDFYKEYKFIFSICKSNKSSSSILDHYRSSASRLFKTFNRSIIIHRPELRNFLLNILMQKKIKNLSK